MHPAKEIVKALVARLKATTFDKIAHGFTESAV
jgi:hypothetical protein